MFFYTHLAIALFFGLVISDYFSNPYLFIAIVLISTILPDIDTKHSKIGKKWFFRPIQFFVTHRGILHSFLFLILVSLLLMILSRTIAFGFLLGYGLHLLLDRIPIKTGGLIETTLFVLFLLGSLGLLGIRVFGLV